MADTLVEIFDRWKVEHEHRHQFEDDRRRRELDLSDKHFVTVNGFAERMAQERAEFMTKSQFDAKNEMLISQLNDLKIWRANFEGRLTGLASIGIILSIISIAIVLFDRIFK